AVNVRAAEWIGRRLARPGVILPFYTAPLRGHRHWPTAAWNVGEGRMTVEASEWPIRRRYKPLAEFLNVKTLRPLSAKATSGFLARAKVAKLRFEADFLPAVREHLAFVSSESQNTVPTTSASKTGKAKSR